MKDGRIVKIGRIDESLGDKVLRADGLVVAPGFIDMHSHDDLVFFKDIANKPKIFQGVITVVCGNCGVSPAPVRRETLDILKSYTGILGREVSFDWSTYGEFLRKLEELDPLGTNFAGLVGHGTLRIAVMGMEARDPTPAELEEMKKLLAQSMKEGAFGMSTGLIYPPGIYSRTEELVELSKVVARYGGYYATHMRNESDAVLNSVAEAIRIGREAGVPVEISHLKVAGRRNWGRMAEVLRMIEKDREEGVDVTADVYPYTAGSTYLAALLPPWAHVGGEERLKERCRNPEVREEMRKFIEEREDWENFVRRAGWENIVITYSPSHPEFTGKSIAKVSEEVGKDPYELVFDILAEDGTDAGMIVFLMNEEDVEKAVTHPYVMVGTDGLDIGVGKPHPRAYGTFPRLLGRYVREKKALTIEEAVRKMTSLPAQKLGLKDRGLIREGFWADIVIFDPKTVIDRATYENPRRTPEGIKHVIVNGVVEIEDGELTDDLGGKVLKNIYSL
ncbi:MAG: amidohydrolase family protein [Desulfurococcales archaeon]|nr:amidohydrolase family protein [Desulfurococcales archaeon]